MKSFLKDLTDFIFVEDAPAPADIIFIPGGMYGAMCSRAAKLWHEGYAPYILPSGKFSKLKERFEGPSEEDLTSPDTAAIALKSFDTEWDYLRACCLTRVFVRKLCSKKTGQPSLTKMPCFPKEVTDSLGLDIKTAIICCQAYHARRCLLYYKCVYPDTHFLVCPTITRGISRENWFLEDSKMYTVLGEIERCGTQFHEIIREQRPSLR